MGGERRTTDQPIHPPSNATAPLKRGKGPGLSGTSWTLGPVFLVAVPRERGRSRGWEQKSPLQVTPCPPPQSQGWSRQPPSSPELGCGSGHFLGQPAALGP